MPGALKLCPTPVRGPRQLPPPPSSQHPLPRPHPPHPPHPTPLVADWGIRSGRAQTSFPPIPPVPWLRDRPPAPLSSSSLLSSARLARKPGSEPQFPRPPAPRWLTSAPSIGSSDPGWDPARGPPARSPPGSSPLHCSSSSSLYILRQPPASSLGTLPPGPEPPAAPSPQPLQDARIRLSGVPSSKPES